MDIFIYVLIKFKVNTGLHLFSPRLVLLGRHWHLWSLHGHASPLVPALHPALLLAAVQGASPRAEAPLPSTRALTGSPPGPPSLPQRPRQGARTTARWGAHPPPGVPGPCWPCLSPALRSPVSPSEVHVRKAPCHGQRHPTG